MPPPIVSGEPAACMRIGIPCAVIASDAPDFARCELAIPNRPGNPEGRSKARRYACIERPSLTDVIVWCCRRRWILRIRSMVQRCQHCVRISENLDQCRILVGVWVAGKIDPLIVGKQLVRPI